MPTLTRLIGLLKPYRAWISLSVLLGFLTIASSIGLLATSAWIISRAAERPSIAALAVAVVGVRFFGVARGVLRYLERLSRTRRPSTSSLACASGFTSGSRLWRRRA